MNWMKANTFLSKHFHARNGHEEKAIRSHTVSLKNALKREIFAPVWSIGWAPCCADEMLNFFKSHECDFWRGRISILLLHVYVGNQVNNAVVALHCIHTHNNCRALCLSQDIVREGLVETTLVRTKIFTTFSIAQHFSKLVWPQLGSIDWTWCP